MRGTSRDQESRPAGRTRAGPNWDDQQGSCHPRRSKATASEVVQSGWSLKGDRRIRDDDTIAAVPAAIARFLQAYEQPGGMLQERSKISGERRLDSHRDLRCVMDVILQGCTACHSTSFQWLNKSGHPGAGLAPGWSSSRLLGIFLLLLRFESLHHL